MTSVPEENAATVEAVVRKHLADALGGLRGTIEAAVPTALFTLTFVITHDLRTALIVSVASAAVLLVVRLIQRSTPKFVLNAFFGIGLGALFAWRSARQGGSASDQALAYFLPGLIYNAGYAVAMVLSIIVRWPLVGFIVGSVADPEAPFKWRADKAMVRLCGRLTAVLAAPCVIRVLAQGPIYLAGRHGGMSGDAAVGLLGTTKLLMGWPLQIAALVLMGWMLTRNRTPITPADASPEPAAAPEHPQPPR